MKKFISALTAASLFISALFLQGCLPASYSQTRRGPAMWIVEDKNGARSYLFGSQHVNKSGDVFPLPDVVEDAFLYCDALAVEYDIIAEEERQAAFSEQERLEYEASFTYPDGQTVKDHVPEKLYEKMSAYVNAAMIRSGVEEGYRGEYDKYNTAMWYSLLESIQTASEGYSVEYGVDRYFLNKARGSGVQILEVESDADQLRMLLEIDDAVYIHMMESMLTYSSGLAYSDMLYQSGDMASLERALKASRTQKYTDEALQAAMEEYDRLMYTERNAIMADSLMKYMSEGRCVFFVVGCAHMLGDDGIVALLRENGYKVYRK